MTAAPDQITYMDTAAGTAVGVDYKQRTAAKLNRRGVPLRGEDEDQLLDAVLGPRRLGLLC